MGQHLQSHDPRCEGLISSGEISPDKAMISRQNRPISYNPNSAMI